MLELSRRSENSQQLDECICPVCFSFHPGFRVRLECPTCPDCASEALTVDVILLKHFLAEATLDKLVEMRNEWALIEGFNETYKGEKLKRMSRVVELKKEFDTLQGFA